ncbi:AAEL017024-PA [Aedes aegypti]|uniref:AAEL017024-PA n=1 Tax=Aedes aegypti TaxID=7159 RepID=J9HI17_AEDAE|nr:AAEL017024-PA [Aedes aegypti]
MEYISITYEYILYEIYEWMKKWIQKTNAEQKT